MRFRYSRWDDSQDPFGPDLAAADRIIAVKAAEHQSIVNAQFSAWRDVVEYWHVHDLDCATPSQTFAHLEQELNQLLTGLSVAAA